MRTFKGRCTNSCPDVFSKTVDEKCTQNSVDLHPQFIDAANVKFQDHQKPLSFIDEKMIQAFGTTMTNFEGSPPAERIDLIWQRAALLRGRVYRVPGGSVGREFASLLAHEYDLLSTSQQKSEKPSMFGKLILQKDKNIRKSPDIRRLVKRRMNMWKNDLLEELIQEAELCEKKMPQSISKMSDDQATSIFTRLILIGDV